MNPFISLLELIKTPDATSVKPTNHIRIPLTAVIQDGIITDLYFRSSKDGSFLWKSNENLTAADILTEVSRQPHPSGIIAYFEGVQEIILPHRTQPTTCSQLVYFTRSTLSGFLQHLSSGTSGIVQEFIEPNSDRCNCVEIEWSSTYFITTFIENKFSLSVDPDPTQTASTFHGPDAVITRTEFAHRGIRSKIQRFCYALTHHIVQLTQSSKMLGGLTAYFRVDSSNQLWLLSVDSLAIVPFQLSSIPQTLKRSSLPSTLPKLRATVATPIIAASSTSPQMKSHPAPNTSQAKLTHIITAFSTPHTLSRHTPSQVGPAYTSTRRHPRLPPLNTPSVAGNAQSSLAGGRYRGTRSLTPDPVETQGSGIRRMQTEQHGRSYSVLSAFQHNTPRRGGSPHSAEELRRQTDDYDEDMHTHTHTGHAISISTNAGAEWILSAPIEMGDYPPAFEKRSHRSRSLPDLPT